MTASARWSVALSNGPSASRERRLERAVDLDHVQVRHARRQVLGEHAQPAADLEHHVGRTELGGPADHAEDVVVDQEVLAELAVGPDLEPAQAAQAGLARLAAHQPSTRAALSLHDALELLVGDARGAPAS